MQYIEPRKGKFGGVSKGELRPVPANYIEEKRNSESLRIWIASEFKWTICPCSSPDPKKGKLLCNKYTPTEGCGPPQNHCNYLSMGNLCMLSAIDETELVKQTAYEMLPALLGIIQTELGRQELEKRFKNAV